jgi:adenylate cyclase
LAETLAGALLRNGLSLPPPALRQAISPRAVIRSQPGVDIHYLLAGLGSLRNRWHETGMPEDRTQRRLAAVLAADVVGYSRLVRADETGTLGELRKVWSEHFYPAVAAHRGRIVKTMGDGVLVEFASAVDAIECAVAIQMDMADRFHSSPGAPPIEFRIGVNIGDIVVDGDDILGDGVNVAVRLEAHAPKGGVLVSEALYTQVRSKTAITLSDAGELSLKNIETPVRAWRWTGDGSGAGTPEVGLPPPGDVPSIAVLSFANLSGRPEQELFADGLVEDIITTLSKLAGLRVIARNSTSVYKGHAIDVRETARHLGVRFILAGSVRKSTRRIRVSVQLIDGSNGSHVWAERYDRDIGDIFAIQDEITLVLATEMQVKLTEGEQARLHYTTTSNVEAWTYWVQGLSHYRRAITEQDSAAALACWRRALALDPCSASLNAMVALEHVTDARFGWWDDRGTALAKAEAHVRRALEMDPDNADAHVTSSFVSLINGQFGEAVDHVRRALLLAPGSADVAGYACFILACAGYPEQAAAQGERATALSPHYPPYYLGILGNAYRLSGRTEEAIAAFKAFHARAPGFGLADLVIVHQQSGRPEQAKEAADQLMRARRNFTISGWAYSQFRADPGSLESDLAALRAAGLPQE